MSPLASIRLSADGSLRKSDSVFRYTQGVVIANDGDGVSAIRVLVVEDFIPFRQYIASKLAKGDNLHVICEVSDGLEAVNQAAALQPDLILLDIGLPTLSGIEAARQIRKLSPESKILFVTQECDAAIVHEAFALGAMGYVLKGNAGSDLSAGIEAVCKGGRFVSSGLSDQYCSC